MRRSRIKVMVTLPVRRKPIKDSSAKKSDSSNLVFDKMIPYNETTEIPPLSRANDSKEILFETIYMPMIKLEKDIEPDSSNPIFINEMVDNEETSKFSESHGEDSKEILFEAINCAKIEDKMKIELQQARILDIAERNDKEELASSCEPRQSIIKEERMENIIEESIGERNTIPEYDSTAECGETRESSVFVNAPVIGASQALTSVSTNMSTTDVTVESLGKTLTRLDSRERVTLHDLIYSNTAKKRLKKLDDPLSVTRKEASSAVTIPMDDDAREEDCEMAEAMPDTRDEIISNDRLMTEKQCFTLEDEVTEKNRESLARNDNIVDDNGSGFYKKRQKSKNWSKWETIKFYKALNTVGTDFSLMQSLFPHRTRQEMKIKYKFEDKNNREFVEKALTDHQEFNIDSLEEDFEKFAARQADESKAKKRRKKKSRSVTSLSIADLNKALYKHETLAKLKNCRNRGPRG